MRFCVVISAQMIVIWLDLSSLASRNDVTSSSWTLIPFCSELCSEYYAIADPWHRSENVAFDAFSCATVPSLSEGGPAKWLKNKNL